MNYLFARTIKNSPWSNKPDKIDKVSGLRDSLAAEPKSDFSESGELDFPRYLSVADLTVLRKDSGSRDAKRLKRESVRSTTDTSPLACDADKDVEEVGSLLVFVVISTSSLLRTPAKEVSCCTMESASSLSSLAELSWTCEKNMRESVMS